MARTRPLKNTPFLMASAPSFTDPDDETKVDPTGCTSPPSPPSSPLPCHEFIRTIGRDPAYLIIEQQISSQETAIAILREGSPSDLSRPEKHYFDLYMPIVRAFIVAQMIVSAQNDFYNLFIYAVQKESGFSEEVIHSAFDDSNLSDYLRFYFDKMFESIRETEFNTGRKAQKKLDKWMVARDPISVKKLIMRNGGFHRHVLALVLNEYSIKLSTIYRDIIANAQNWVAQEAKYNEMARHNIAYISGSVFDDVPSTPIIISSSSPTITAFSMKFYTLGFATITFEIVEMVMTTPTSLSGSRPVMDHILETPPTPPTAPSPIPQTDAVMESDAVTKPVIHPPTPEEALLDIIKYHEIDSCVYDRLRTHRSWFW